MIRVEVWQKKGFLQKEKFLYILHEGIPDEVYYRKLKYNIEYGMVTGTFIKEIEFEESIKSHLDFTWKE